MKPAEPEGLHDLTGRQTYQNVDQRGPTTSCKHKGRRGGSLDERGGSFRQRESELRFKFLSAAAANVSLRARNAYKNIVPGNMALNNIRIFFCLYIDTRCRFQSALKVPF